MNPKLLYVIAAGVVVLAVNAAAILSGLVGTAS